MPTNDKTFSARPDEVLYSFERKINDRYLIAGWRAAGFELARAAVGEIHLKDLEPILTARP
ncbi:hypothetical protein ACDH53_19195 [Pseudomonas tremae]|uniref:Uncharacterized protein n=1 Tax=Pseudomonas tremae TaxID=200454 RepID=A0ABV4PHF8_9PSED|nr:hypothetical protein [Pseudomonas coronafaciens]